MQVLRPVAHIQRMQLWQAMFMAPSLTPSSALLTPSSALLTPSSALCHSPTTADTLKEVCIAVYYMCVREREREGGRVCVLYCNMQVLLYCTLYMEVL